MMKVNIIEGKRFRIGKLCAVLLALSMLMPVGIVFTTSATEADNTNYDINTTEYPPTMVYGRVVDRFGAPVDMFVVVFNNVQSNITNYTWGERGWYEYNLAEIGVTAGDMVELASSDGNCIYNYTFVYMGVAVRHDFVLHPDGPEPPGLPPTWDMDGFEDYDGFEHPDDFFDPDHMLDPDDMFFDDTMQPMFKPDLRVMDVWVEPVRPVQGETVVVSALVTTTSLFFDTYEVAFYLDDVGEETMFGSVLVHPEPGKITRTISVSLDTGALEGLHVAVVVSL